MHVKNNTGFFSYVVHEVQTKPTVCSSSRHTDWPLDHEPCRRHLKTWASLWCHSVFSCNLTFFVAKPKHIVKAWAMASAWQDMAVLCQVLLHRLQWWGISGAGEQRNWWSCSCSGIHGALQQHHRAVCRRWLLAWHLGPASSSTRLWKPADVFANTAPTGSTAETWEAAGR